MSTTLTLHVVILMIAIVGADKTCTKEEDISHLVQSLQSCANAITGLQPSSEIQEKCSPDAGLLQKIENISLTLANITQQIAAIEEDIATNKYNITANKISINEDIITIQKNITSIEKSIADNAVNITTNAASITTNADNIAMTIAKSFDIVCNSSGWTRVAYLDMTLTLEECPTGFGLYNVNGVRACGRQTLSYGCNSVTFSTYGISYSEVCGRVIGYQYGQIDGVRNYVLIDDPYVDGISITHGSPRQHVWTLVNGRSESGTSSYFCPCNTRSIASVPSFVGNDYFCESGTASYPTTPYQLYTDDPLWDGEGCGGNEGPCCNAPGIPWFHKVLNSPTTDYIELRVCGDGSDEDSPVTLYEIYVK